jgi:hypothetical protein
MFLLAINDFFHAYYYLEIFLFVIHGCFIVVNPDLVHARQLGTIVAASDSYLNISLYHRFLFLEFRSAHHLLASCSDSWSEYLLTSSLPFPGIQVSAPLACLLQ